MPIIVGITSLPGSGATTVSKLFQKFGFAVISADEIAHKLLHRKRIKEKLVDLFGKKILEGKNIDRKKLAKIVFADKTKLKKLNEVTHSAIISQITKEVKKARKKGRNAVVDAPLLFEKKLNKLCDVTVAVIAHKKLCIERLKKKGFNKLEAMKILRLHKLKFKKEKADYVLYNNGSLDELKEKVRLLWEIIKK